MLSNVIGCLVFLLIFAVFFYFIYAGIAYYVKCYKCGKWHHKGVSYCTDCHVMIAGDCPNCGVNQKWRGSGCMQCGYDLISGRAISPVNVRTTPMPATTLYSSSCPNCGEKTPQGAAFCGSCGFNLEQTMVHEQGPL